MKSEGWGEGHGGVEAEPWTWALQGDEGRVTVETAEKPSAS